MIVAGWAGFEAVVAVASTGFALDCVVKKYPNTAKQHNSSTHDNPIPVPISMFFVFMLIQGYHEIFIVPLAFLYLDGQGDSLDKAARPVVMNPKAGGGILV